ncbi:MAG: response regulator [Treponema sp.]|jgi:DNA-binding response OmpR family regulator|nr:response regulator [Treponema sp.]
MKQVLIISESPLLREYLCLKLEENGLDVTTAIAPVEGVARMRSLAPDLIILDYLQDHHGFMELLKQKKSDLNTVKTPVIIFAQELEQRQLLELVPYNVKKVFNKPLKIDALFATLSELLGISFSVDTSPGILEVHVNENIIFIELAQGFNRDKLDLLRFKLSELIDLYRIRVPKVIIMLSDIQLHVRDAPNLQKLLHTVLDSSKAKQRYIRVLTTEDFVHQFISKQKDFTGIEVVSTLEDAMNGLVAIDTETGDAEEKAERIGNIILKAKSAEDDEDLVFKFEAEVKKTSIEEIKDSLKNLEIAVIDDDIVIQEMVKNTFMITGAFVFPFFDGDEFLEMVDKQDFDLAFLDINMPKVDGFEVLKALQTRNIKYPIIVLSAISQREAMVKAIQMGIKSYLVKPLKPEDIFRKSIEILKANF